MYKGIVKNQQQWIDMTNDDLMKILEGQNVHATVVDINEGVEGKDTEVDEEENDEKK